MVGLFHFNSQSKDLHSVMKKHPSERHRPVPRSHITVPCLALSCISFSTSAPPPPHSLLKLLLCSLNSSSSLQPLPCWCWSSLLLLSFCSSPPHLVQSLLKCPVMERGVCHQVYRRLAAHLWGVLSAGSLQRSSQNQGCPPLRFRETSLARAYALPRTVHMQELTTGRFKDPNETTRKSCAKSTCGLR